MSELSDFHHNKSTRMYECATSVLDRIPETSRGKLWMCRTVFRVISLLSKYWHLKIVDVFLVTSPPFFKRKNYFQQKIFHEKFSKFPDHINRSPSSDRSCARMLLCFFTYMGRSYMYTITTSTTVSVSLWIHAVIFILMHSNIYTILSCSLGACKTVY